MQLDAARTYSRTKANLRPQRASAVRARQTQANISIDAWGLLGIAIVVLFLLGKFKIPFLSK